MILKLLVLFVAIVRSVTLENDRYIIALHGYATLKDIDNVVEIIEQREMNDKELTEMEYLLEPLPMVFANISDEIANKVRFTCISSFPISLVLLIIQTGQTTNIHKSHFNTLVIRLGIS